MRQGVCEGRYTGAVMRYCFCLLRWYRELVGSCSDASCRSSRWKSHRWNCSVATVVISGGGAGDRTVESPEVKVSEREASDSAGRSKGEPISPEMVLVENAEPSGALGEGKCCREGTECKQRQVLRGLRGRHAGKERCSESAEPLAGRLGAPHSEGIAYKPPCGEIVMCLRVGRMGPIK